MTAGLKQSMYVDCMERPVCNQNTVFEYVDNGSGSTMLVIVQAPMFHNRSDAFRVQGPRVIVSPVVNAISPASTTSDSFFTTP